jgi:hypothetical protein
LVVESLLLHQSASRQGGASLQVLGASLQGAGRFPAGCWELVNQLA